MGRPSGVDMLPINSQTEDETNLLVRTRINWPDQVEIRARPEEQIETVWYRVGHGRPLKSFNDGAPPPQSMAECVVLTSRASSLAALERPLFVMTVLGDG